MFSFVCIGIAVLFHGLGHLLAARMCGVPLQRLQITRTGLRLVTRDRAFPSYVAEGGVALGGPLGTLLGNALFLLVARLTRGNAALFFAQLCGQLVPVSLSLALWNMLPIEGFDGGRLLRCLLCLAAKEPGSSLLCAQRALSVCSAGCLFLLWFFSVYLLLRAGTALSLYLFCAELFLTLYEPQKNVRHRTSDTARKYCHYRPKEK